MLRGHGWEGDEGRDGGMPRLCFAQRNYSFARSARSAFGCDSVSEDGCAKIEDFFSPSSRSQIFEQFNPKSNFLCEAVNMDQKQISTQGV